MSYESKPGILEFFRWLCAYPGRRDPIEFVIWRSNLMHWWIWPWLVAIVGGLFWLVLGLGVGSVFGL